MRSTPFFTGRWGAAKLMFETENAAYGIIAELI